MMDEIDDKADKADAGWKAGLVSIVVPVYNAERFIEETIARVQAQTYDSWELLLVDDCSTDRSRELISRRSAEDRRVRLIAQEQNGGAARARNRGIREAGGSLSGSWRLSGMCRESGIRMPDLCSWAMSLRTDRVRDLEKWCMCRRGSRISRR